MKITKGQLRQIIREEVSRVTTEQKDFDAIDQHEAEPENEAGKELVGMLVRAVNHSGNKLATGPDLIDQSTALNNIIMAAGRAVVALDSGDEEGLKLQLSYIDDALEDASR